MVINDHLSISSFVASEIKIVKWQHVVECWGLSPVFLVDSQMYFKLTSFPVCILVIELQQMPSSYLSFKDDTKLLE